MVVLASTVVFAFVALQTAASASPPRSQSIAQSRQINDAREMTLVLPHPLQKGETAWLLVKVGAIGRDQVQLTTQDGQPLGTISPFAIPSGKPGGTYTVPIPAKALSDGRLTLRLSVIPSGGAPRAPTTQEIKSVRLLIRHFKEGN
jgi:hypothetical protein